MSDISKVTKLKRRQTFVNNVIAINNCVIRLSGCFDVWMYGCMVTHIARVWINRVRLPILLLAS